MPSRVNYPGTIARWLPKEPGGNVRKHQSNLLAQLIEKGVCTRAGDVDPKRLSPVILEFKKLIEEDAEIFRAFHEMFDQVRPGPDSDHLLVSDCCNNHCSYPRR